MFLKHLQTELEDSSSYLSFDLRMFCLLNLIASEVAKSGTGDSCRRMPSPVPAFGIVSEKHTPCGLNKWQESTEEECDGHLPDVERDDMLVRRMGTFQRHATSPVPIHCPPLSVAPHLLQQQQQGEAVAREKDLKTPREAERSENRSRSL